MLLSQYMSLYMRRTSNTLIGLLASVFIVLLASSPAYAQGSTNLHIAAGYSKGNGEYTIVARDKAWTKLTLYTDTNQTVKATTNKNDWATFNNVKLTNDTGQLTFFKLYNGQSLPVGYNPWYTLNGSKVSFSLNPNGTPQQITAWYNKYGATSITALSNDFSQLSTEGTDSSAIENTCTQIFDDATKAEGIAPIPIIT
jgi:hypothetical protein